MVLWRVDLEHSPCCNLPLVVLPRGLNATDHFRCSECRALWCTATTKLEPCNQPELHAYLSLQSGRRENGR